MVSDTVFVFVCLFVYVYIYIYIYICVFDFVYCSFHLSSLYLSLKPRGKYNVTANQTKIAGYMLYAGTQSMLVCSLLLCYIINILHVDQSFAYFLFLLFLILFLY